MIYLLRHLKEFNAKVQGKNVFLFLDYDGTIVPIAERPGKAKLSRETKIILKKLSNTPGVIIAVVTGRPLSNIMSAIALKKMIYVGNHGLEIAGPDFTYAVCIPRRFTTLLKELKTLLIDIFRKIHGLMIEDKKVALAIHYRNVDPGKIRSIKQSISDALCRCDSLKILRVEEGKKVYEIRPAIDWNKGDAVSWLMTKYATEPFSLTHHVKNDHIIHRLQKWPNSITRKSPKSPFVAIFIGDDITDENGFHAVNDHGISIHVGKTGASSAVYYVKDPAEVAHVLEEIHGRSSND
ncbi:MAG: trehalose-phosphatase [Endomicrobiales bacterium]